MRHALSAARVKVGVKFDTRSLERSLAAIESLVASPELIAQLLRNAVAETLLAAYRRRFLENFEKALSPEILNGSGAGPLAESAGAATWKVELTRAYESLSKAQARGDAAGLALAQQKIERAERRLVEHSVRPKGASALSTGQFRELAMQVLRTMTDASLIAMDVAQDEVSVGLLHLPTLERIKTPSATPQLTGHATSSKFTILWRQLEFGTGVYARMPGVQPRGGWFYGPRPGYGLQLLGAQGVHAVFDAATGLPYEKDALEFEQVFAGMLGRALAGR